MVEVDGAYWVFYSGNWFNQPRYAIGAARCAGPAGPCPDQSTGPPARLQPQGPGPGEASVFADGDGDLAALQPVAVLAAQARLPAAPGVHHPARFRPVRSLPGQRGPPARPAVGRPLALPLWA